MTGGAIHWDTIAPVRPTSAGLAESALRGALGQAGALRRLLESAAADRQPILLAVNDPQRSTRTRSVIEALAGIVQELAPRPLFRALVATGTHTFHREEEARFEESLFGDCGLDVTQVAWHDARDAAGLAAVGGVAFHRWVAESRFLLPVGSVEPHYFAGVTGPHKTITIGCMGYADIERNHEGALDPASDILRLRGNPVYDDVAGYLARLHDAGKTICAVGQVACGDTLVALSVGEPLAVVEELLPTVRRVFEHRVPAMVDVLHLRAGPPLDRSLYQAEKAWKNNHRAVRDGGGILLEAECDEGVGPSSFLSLLQRSTDHATALQRVKKDGYRLGDHKAVKLRHLTDPSGRGVHVALVTTSLEPSLLENTGIPVFGDTAAALDWLGEVVEGPLRTGLLVEDAAMVCVCV
ncbi:MAG: lactate racemase domain-containing protein [Phycisphaerae bacterium]